MLKDKTDQELRKILLTVDGMGKIAKEEALNELLERRYQSNVKDLPVQSYTNEAVDNFGGWKS